MKRLTFVVALFLLGFGEALAQQGEWKSVYSDEFHFMASFPGEAKRNTGKLDTAFGHALTTQWSLDVPGASYEVLVADIAGFRVNRFA
jgi:hypothetical protein